MTTTPTTVRTQLRRVPGVVPAHRLYRSRREVIEFQRGETCDLGLRQRLSLLGSFLRVTDRVTCEHTEGEMLTVAAAILRSSGTPGVVVEAGCYKGGSTAKLSKVAALVDKRCVVFDSFEGIPPNAEDHGRNIYGGQAGFAAGDYAGSLEEVRANVGRYGDLGRCEFVKGWFCDTVGHFDEPIAVAYLDVDLVSSTRECLGRFYPVLVEGGVIFSQDGHLPLVIDLLGDCSFWASLPAPEPVIEGLGTRKLVAIRKPRP